MKLKVTSHKQSFPLAQVFRISRGAKTCAEVITVSVSDGQNTGWGESVPYARYSETPDSVANQITTFCQDLEKGVPFETLLARLLPGSARNALDCAWWDLQAKQHKTDVYDLLNLPRHTSCITAQTLSIDTTESMARAASKLADYPLIKVKLDGEFVLAKMEAIHQACPHSQFIIDANEAWDMALLEQVVNPLRALNVALIEQPLAAENDHLLKDFHSPIPLCADESCHTSKDLDRLSGLYQAINIKLDKTGGLTEAVNLLKEAKQRDLQVMVGCMVGTSLAMAPAFTLCDSVEFVDLDGPTLVAQDRHNGFTFSSGKMSAPEKLLWGKPDNTFTHLDENP